MIPERVKERTVVSDGTALLQKGSLIRASNMFGANMIQVRRIHGTVALDDLMRSRYERSGAYGMDITVVDLVMPEPAFTVYAAVNSVTCLTSQVFVSPFEHSLSTGSTSTIELLEEAADTGDVAALKLPFGHWSGCCGPPMNSFVPLTWR